MTITTNTMIMAICILNFVMLLRVMIVNDRARSKLFSLRHFIRRREPDPKLGTGEYYWGGEDSL